MSADHPGIGLGDAALQRVGNSLNEGRRTLADLTGELEHITVKPAVWREAVAYLAAQVWAERNETDAAKARDARFALRRIAEQVDWFNGRHGSPR